MQFRDLKTLVLSFSGTGKMEDEEILEYVFRKIDEAQIWIPSGEIYGYYRRRKSKLLKRLKKEFFSEEITE